MQPNNNEMAKLIVEENQRLRKENEDLLQVNEELKTQVSSATAQINESKLTGTQEQRLAELDRFEEAHGALADVETSLSQALQISESVTAFTKKHGPLKQVDESLRKLSLRMDHIQESMKLADQAHALMEQHGSLESIGEALTASAPIVEAYAKSKTKIAFRNLCASHNISESRALAMMEKGNLNLSQLGNILESMGDCSKLEECDADGNPLNECDDENMDEAMKISEARKRRQGINESLVLPAIGSVYKKGDEVAKVETVGDDGVTVVIGGESKTIGMAEFADWSISEEMSGEGDDPLNETEKPKTENTEDNPDLNKVNESKGQPGAFKMRSRADNLVTGRNFIQSERPPQSISEGFDNVRDTRNLSRVERLVTQDNRPRRK